MHTVALQVRPRPRLPFVIGELVAAVEDARQNGDVVGHLVAWWSCVKPGASLDKPICYSLGESKADDGTARSRAHG